ncbi:hypothetical protein P153DRAFT_195285 [Dothidotthia symphoricarpi CBS 119687]|uniref:SUZ domain-containing protein n=1 Tax=Dothidotthia symphoricarpi CBS 119687 TaxID=1392245 RepID=A0A6A6AK09_9PLEO|nr:uncharacterized protein P153DRAFT_195285 [Dothidotthia symphoricarpi CBS 119687]KAF2131425.1 hypothetical protein P153DRAFT_195285 [Dothidotthia symphoricarpi CBS 119687]
MPPKKTALADAWDDDWESIADKEDSKPQTPQPEPKLSKAERKAQHVELNRRLWESAENPEPKLFLQARDNVPVLSSFKPNVTVLARKPQVLSRNNPTSGMAGLNLDDDDDSEEERRKKAEIDFEERKARAQKERAEKERKYAEARERIFGSPAAAEGSRSNSPNKATRGKGRGRGGRDSQPRSSNEQSPAPPAGPGRQLFDHSYSPKPGSVYIQRREAGTSRPGTPSEQERPIRQPQGPATSGGRGFASRGVHTQVGPS